MMMMALGKIKYLSIMFMLFLLSISLDIDMLLERGGGRKWITMDDKEEEDEKCPFCHQFLSFFSFMSISTSQSRHCCLLKER